MSQKYLALIGGVIFLVLGLVLESTIIGSAATAGSNTRIGSFSGAQDVNDIIPLIYNAGILIAGLGIMFTGMAGIAGRGPLKG